SLGSMSLAEADLVRRASAKFSGRSDRDRLRGKFLKAAGMMGLTSQQREETWMMVEKFAGFGFCKAHAATYADISYRMAYLKTHHAAEFLAAMCSAGAGFYHVSAYVEEAKRWGIAVRLPSVNHSRMEYTVEEKLRYEREILEVCVSGHPLDFLPRNGEAWSDELPGLRGKRVTLCGWVVTYRHVGTKNYRNMMFVTLEDQRGIYEVVLFP